MSVKRIPFENTSVSVEKSISEVIGHLKRCGFTRIAQFDIDNNWEIRTEMQGVGFRFAPNYESIVEILRTRSRYYDLSLRKEQAKRIAWRLIVETTKANADAIELGAENIPSAFGGVMQLKVNGKDVSLGNLMIEKIQSGEVSSIALLGSAKQ